MPDRFVRQGASAGDVSKICSHVEQLKADIHNVLNAYPGTPTCKLHLIRANGWSHSPTLFSPSLKTTTSAARSIPARLPCDISSQTTPSSLPQVVPRGDLSQWTYSELCKRQLNDTDRASFLDQPWMCPSHAIAPLPPVMGSMVNPFLSRPHWFNNLSTCAILPNGKQLGSTCGLHACCHLLWGATALRMTSPISPPNRAEFEAVGFRSKSGDASRNLIEPGGGLGTV